MQSEMGKCIKSSKTTIFRGVVLCFFIVARAFSLPCPPYTPATFPRLRDVSLLALDVVFYAVVVDVVVVCIFAGWP